jgi:hypothetical protein
MTRHRNQTRFLTSPWGALLASWARLPNPRGEKCLTTTDPPNPTTTTWWS